MLMKMRSKMQNQKGFTLVELMVVVVILGILVAIAVPIYNNVTANAEKNACWANQRSIEGAWMIFQADKASNPDATFDAAEYLVGATFSVDDDTGTGTITFVNPPTPQCSYTLTEGVAECSVEEHARITE